MFVSEIGHHGEFPTSLTGKVSCSCVGVGVSTCRGACSTERDVVAADAAKKARKGSEGLRDGKGGY